MSLPTARPWRSALMTSKRKSRTWIVLERSQRLAGIGLHKRDVYPIREKGVDNLWFQPLDRSTGRQLTKFSSLKIYSYRWSFDGKSLALVRGDSPSDLALIKDEQRK